MFYLKRMRFKRKTAEASLIIYLERFAAGPIEYFGLAAFIIIIVGGLHPPAHATSESVGEASAELPPAGACVGTQGGKPSGLWAEVCERSASWMERKGVRKCAVICLASPCLRNTLKTVVTKLFER